MSKRLSRNTTLNQLHTEARQLLEDLKSGDPAACKRIGCHPDHLYRNLNPGEVKRLELTLADARLIVAREYRHRTWTDIEETLRRVRELQTTPVQEAILEDRVGDLRKMLSGQAALVRETIEWLTRWNQIQTGSLLSFAQENGTVASIEAVVEAGADPTELQDQFFGLCENLNLDGMRRMVAIGLDPNRAFNDGWNCDVLHGCLQTYTRKSAEHLHACVNLLIDAGARYEDGPLWDLFRGRKDRLEQRLAGDARLVDVKFDFDYGNHLSLRRSTLLHLAAEYNLFWAVDLLLHYGADLNARVEIGVDGVGGQTPIYHTIASNSGVCFALFEYLLSKQPDLKVKAFIQEDPQRGGAVTHSLRSGVVPVYEGIREVTPLGYALWYEKEPTFRNAPREVELLRDIGAPE